MQIDEFIKNLGSSIKISRVTQVIGEPGEKTTWHAHYNRLHLAFIESGRGVYEMRGKIWQLRANTVIMAMPGEFHEFSVDTRYPYRAWFIYLEWFGNDPDFLPCCWIADKKIFRLLPKLASAVNQHQSKLLQYGLLLQVFALMAEENPCGNSVGAVAQVEPGIAPVFKALHGPPFNYPGIDALSELSGVSRRSFTAWFRKITGQSVKEYYLDKVMTYAERMFQDNMPLQELATQCGYSNAQNFMTAFRNYQQKKSENPPAAEGFRA